jgi:8-oxo-dGTP diphosphatase
MAILDHMNTHTELFKKLQADPERNCALHGFFENYPVKDVFTEGDSHIITGKSDHLWAYISSTSEEELTVLLDKHGRGLRYFASIEDWMKAIIRRNNVIAGALITTRLFFPASKDIPPLTEEVERLDRSMVEYIFKHTTYQQYTSREYINERIERGVSAGIFHEGELASWALTHDDDSVGFLHTLPKFRGKGHARNIMSAMIQQKREQNKQVYVNIELGNDPTMNLFMKLGFDVDRKVSWVKLK